MRTTMLGFALAALVAGPVLPGAGDLAAQEPERVAEGAQVWADNCTRCHNARPSQERTDSEWLTIVLHMRARANLTRTDADLVATFMRATNLPETAVAEVPGPPAPVGESGAAPAVPPDLATMIRYLRIISGD